MSERYRLAYDQALANGGVITRKELNELGITARMIEGRVASGQWRVVARGVYRLAEPADRRNLMRSVLAAWPGVVISHESAAEVHEFPFVTSDRVVASHHSRTTHRFPDVDIRRTHDLDDWHVTEINRIRVTTVARTVVDLASDRPASLIGRLLDQLITRESVELFEVEAVVEAVGRRGKPGITTMRKVLEVRSGADRSASVLEQRGRKLIADAGLPVPVPEFPIPWTTGRRFDDAYPDRKLAIEWDSRRYHGQRAAFEADRARDRDAAVHGWRILRFTWDDVVNYPSRITETLAHLLAA
ncbi:MAG: type IV toxin-antitoxin system AbiEi family antitoxin domain-containing protein [Acidimicrobiia bacterium]